MTTVEQGFLRETPPAGYSLGALSTTDAATQQRYAGGKQSATAVVTSAGATTVLTPTLGKALRVYWVSAINDPDADVSPLIQVSLGAQGIYAAYAIAHWEIFTGAVNQPLIVTLDQAASVAVTVHYTEVS